MVELKKELNLSEYDMEHIIYKLSCMKACFDEMDEEEKTKNTCLKSTFLS